MNDSLITVQQAIYELFVNDTELMATVTGVFDTLPDDQPYPFITIGDFTTVDESTVEISGMNLTLTIHTWDEGESRLRLKQLMAQIVNLVHHAELEDLGSPQIHNIVNVSFEFSTLFKDPDGVTLHGVQRFRIVTDEVIV